MCFTNCSILLPSPTYYTYVLGNWVTWRNKKQLGVARNSVEAKYHALALSICEGMWLKRLLKEREILSTDPIKVFCDNLATISIAENPVHHEQTKHVEIDRYFIKEKAEEGILQLVSISTNTQATGVLTKSLLRVKFEELVSKLGISKLGMINIYSQLEGKCGKSYLVFQNF